MKLFSLLSAPALLLGLLLVPQAEAQSTSSALEKHLKASYNEMVQDVRRTESPVEKREIIAGFLTRLDRGLGLVEKLVPESESAHIKATRLRTTMKAHLDELNGMDMQGPTAGNTLNSFASYLQQDVEQADGIYLSVGALIIILLILIIVL
jgi:hypothetical protein